MNLLSMSQDDLKMEGSALNISPDTTTSIRYSGANVPLSIFITVISSAINNNTGLTGLDYSLSKELNMKTWESTHKSSFNCRVPM